MTTNEQITKLPRADDSYSSGDCVIRELGEIHLADGRRFWGAIVQFPAGPPNIPISVVWEGKPMLMTVKP